tara:strand:+ start:92004 stop:93002 length:999 start_codon:yes stop_codon:yes gene_type:complete
LARTSKARKERKEFNPSSMKKMEYTVIVSVLAFAIAFIGLSFFTGMDNVWDKFNSLSAQTWAILLSLSLVNYVGRGLKWHLFGKRLGFKIPLKRMAIYYFSGMSMTVTPGKIGTGLRLWFLKKCHKVSYSKGLPLMIMDPITDLASLFIMCLAGVASFGGGQNASLFVFGAILGGLMLLFAKPKLFLLVIKGLYSLTKRTKPRRFAALQKMIRHITTLVSPKVFTSTVFFSMIGWGASTLAFHTILVQMGADISFTQAMFIFSFATILGGATMSPGGLGGTEAAMVIALIALGIPEETAIAATLVIRTTTLWFGVFVGFMFLPFAMKIAKQK